MGEMKLTFKTPEEIYEFVNTVSKYEFDVDVRRGRVVVDAKSLLGIMHLGLNSIRTADKACKICGIIIYVFSILKNTDI